MTAALAGSLAQAQTTERVSVATGGAQGNTPSFLPSISVDGRFVAFHGYDSNLVAGDTNGTDDVFVHDRQSGTTERVSVATGGAQGSAHSQAPAISGDGRFVAFHSLASNLVAGDTNGFHDIFVHDRQSGTTERVSVATGGTQGNGNSGGLTSGPSISEDGRFVAFYSYASDLVAGDTNGFYDIFVRDRQSGTTERVSLATGGAQGNSDSNRSSISTDCRFVAFESLATNLVAGDTNGFYDVFVHDRQSGTTERVSVGPAGAQGDSPSDRPSISADGRFVAFQSYATNLVAGDTSGFSDVFVRDRQSGTTERVSIDSAEAQGNSDSDSPSISSDGWVVAFRSHASNLVLGDTNVNYDVFAHDRQSGTSERVSVATNGSQGNHVSNTPSISADGRFVAFQSFASNLVASDTNGVYDGFVRDRSSPPPRSPFCFGDGTGTACPCGNAGITGHGCANSLNANGAILSGSGNTSLSGDTLVLAGGGMPNASALYFQGTNQLNGGLGAVFGDGLRCAGGMIIRLGTKTNVAGSSQYPSGADAPVSVRGLVTSAGIRTYQVWYRNAAAFCTVSTFNLSNGLAVQWNP